MYNPQKSHTEVFFFFILCYFFKKKTEGNLFWFRPVWAVEPTHAFSADPVHRSYKDSWSVFAEESFFLCFIFFQPRCSTRETRIRLPPFYSKHIPPLNFCSLQLHFLPPSVSRSVTSYPHLFIIFHLQTTTWTLKETRNLSASVWSPKWIHNNNHAQ